MADVEERPSKALTDQEISIRVAGQQLHDLGGIAAMLEVWESISSQANGSRLQDRLAKVWSGIGDWQA